MSDSFHRRGVHWLFHSYTDGIVVEAFVFKRVLYQSFSQRGSSFVSIADFLLESAIRGSDSAVGVDGVPWELHRIDDEAARLAAIAAWKQSRV